MSTPKEDGEQWHRDKWHAALLDDQDDAKRQGARLRMRAMTAALVVYKYAHSRPGCYLSVRRLALEGGMARDTAQAALDDLVRAGWLAKLDRTARTKADAYEMTWPAHLSLSQPLGREPVPATGTPAPAPCPSTPALVSQNTGPGVPAPGTNNLNKHLTNPPTPRSIAAGLLDLDEDEDGELLEHLPQLLEDAERRMGQPIRSMKHFLTSKRADLRRELEQLRDAAARQPAPLRTISTANDPQYDGPTVSDDFLAAMREKRRRALITELADKTRIP